jgi:hypothetical protein
LLTSLRHRKRSIEELSRNSHSPPNHMSQLSYDPNAMRSAFANPGALQGGHPGY